MNIFDGIVVTEVISALAVNSIENRRDAVENRSHYGLSFCAEGQITYIHRGIEYISDNSCAIILPKGQSYTIFRNRSGIFPVINFDTLEPLCDTHVIIPISDTAPLFADFSLLRTCLRSGKDRARSMSIFYEIIQKLSGGVLDLGVITPAVEYMKEYYSSPELSNSFLSDLCGISEIYFRRLFLEKLGVTPRQYIIDMRLAKAKEMLSDGILKISAIAESCGFTNPYHFTRTFKERIGMTPGEYMRRSRAYHL